MKNYLENNTETYEHVYKEGWGNTYTDTLWVSIFHRVAKKYLKQKENIKVLDFGCGIGANPRFFGNLG